MQAPTPHLPLCACRPPICPCHNHHHLNASTTGTTSPTPSPHQCFDRLLDPPWTSWGQLVQHPKVSKLPCPQAMSKSPTISLQSDDQQAGKFHKLGKSIW